MDTISHEPEGHAQLASKAMSQIPSRSASFIQHYFRSRLKTKYRYFTDPMKIYYREPEAVLEEVLPEHIYFKDSYRALQFAKKSCKTPADQGMAITECALSRGPVTAMIAISCLSFRDLLMANLDDEFKQIIRLSEKYPKVRQYLLKAEDLKKHPEYFPAIVKIARLDVQFAFKALKDDIIKKAFLGHPDTAAIILDIIETLYDQVSQQNPAFDLSTTKDLLTLIGYVMENPTIALSIPKDSRIDLIQEALTIRVEDTYRNQGESIALKVDGLKMS